MMWNFLVGGLSAGSTLVLYDGSPLKDPSFLWKLVDELGITIFGTSAKYLDGLAVRSSTRLRFSLSVHFPVRMIFTATCAETVTDATLSCYTSTEGLSSRLAPPPHHPPPNPQHWLAARARSVRFRV